ncbi:MAG: FAD-dependent oxidoreductase [Bryobacterales bacterium]|nr:FAD-dependent oxidoreductase [Bryobacterales bacterium]MEB2362741.1 FAD-dependent oxidoreductase [Bryobacterales bacterium]
MSVYGKEVAASVDCAEGDPDVKTDDLGLEKAGVPVDERGYIIVDDQLRTIVPGMWAMGDCNGKGAFTHTCFNDAGTGESHWRRPAPG